jgi:hypothetical protein
VWARLAAPRSGGAGASSRRQHLSSSASARSGGGGGDRAQAPSPASATSPCSSPRSPTRRTPTRRASPGARSSGSPRRARRHQSPKEPLQQETARRSVAPQAWSLGRCPTSGACATWSPSTCTPDRAPTPPRTRSGSSAPSPASSSTPPGTRCGHVLDYRVWVSDPAESTLMTSTGPTTSTHP